MQALRRMALQYPEADEGTACTKSAFKARNKSFLFVGWDDTSYNVMLKLGDSLAEAARLAASEPERYKVGATGWVTATLAHDDSPPQGLFERWIDESYRLLVHQQLVAMLPQRGGAKVSAAKTGGKPRKPNATKKKTAKKRAVSG